MKRVVFVAILAAASSGCVTTAALVKPDRVSLPLLLGAAVGDFVVVSLVASQATDISNVGAVGTGLAVMAVDVGVGCVLGACKALRP